MIKEHDRVVLTKPVASEGLEDGDVGTVYVYKNGQASNNEVGREGQRRKPLGLEDSP